ncbi:MAG: hypothetical protein U0T56_01150 [Ferruginibacter sp.]
MRLFLNRRYFSWRFDKIRQLLANHARTEQGKERAFRSGYIPEKEFIDRGTARRMNAR